MAYVSDYIGLSVDDFYKKTARILNKYVSSGGGGAASWGTISGTLSTQTDLQSALNAKADTSSLSGYVPTSRTINGSALSSNVTIPTLYSADGSTSGVRTVTLGGKLTFTGNTVAVSNGLNLTDVSSVGKTVIGGFTDIGGFTNTLLGMKMLNSSGTERQLAIVNSSNTVIFAVHNNSRTYTSATTYFTGTQMAGGAATFSFQGSQPATYNNYQWGFFSGNPITTTSGATQLLKISNPSSHVSGTNVNTSLLLEGTINQTGSATGTTIRGFYYNPNIISILGSHIAFEATSGRTILKSVETNLVAKTTTYTATAEDYTITVNVNSGSFNLTLPTAIGCNGRIYIIKRIDASGNLPTVVTTSSQTIDGGTTYTGLSAQWKYIQVQSDGANWVIIANN